MNAIQLRRKVARLKEAKRAEINRGFAMAIIDNIDRATPGGFNGTHAHSQTLIGVLGTVFSVLGAVFAVLIVIGWLTGFRS